MRAFVASDDTLLPNSCCAVSSKEVEELATWLAGVGCGPLAQRLLDHWTEIVGHGTDIMLSAVKPPGENSEARETRLLMFVGAMQMLADLCGEVEGLFSEAGAGSLDETESPWVPAFQLWKAQFRTMKEVDRFREKHPEMFRNPSRYRLEIHARRWLTYWSERNNAGFESLDGDMPSIADDPTVQQETLKDAARRMGELRAKKRSKK
ncbi:MAG: hypothetical protein ACOX1P_05230 [Thermoguttaceae bacterium]